VCEGNKLVSAAASYKHQAARKTAKSLKYKVENLGALHFCLSVFRLKREACSLRLLALLALSF
jgi:hypothetical protein